MATDKRGVQQIKTMGGIVDGRRVRTSSRALLVLYIVVLEEQRLTTELYRPENRSAEIRARVHEIDTKQLRLQRFVERPLAAYQAGQALAAAPPLPIHTAPTDRLKRRALSY